MKKPMKFGFSFGENRSDSRRQERPRFRMLVLGDFSGRKHSDSLDSSNDRPLIEVACNTLDAAIAKVSAKIELALPGINDEAFTLRFESLDDFHPDRLLTRIPQLQTLKDLHNKLNNPATFESAAAIVRSWSHASPPPPASSATGEPASVKEPHAESVDDVLTRLLGRPRSAAVDTGATSAKPGNVDAFIRRIVATTPAIQTHPERAQLVATVEAELSRTLRRILHHTAFQAIEANWRGLDFLLRNIETDEDMEVWLWDISKDELGMDLGSAKSPEASLFYRKGIGHALDSTAKSPWAAFVGLYHLAPSQEDIDMLRRLAFLADKTDAVFLAAADYKTWNTSFIAETQDPNFALLWNQLRRAPEAERIGLLVPRFLLRLPYGQDTDPIDEFTFEEWGGDETRRPYLWGNPALVAACLLGQSFNQSGWDFAAGEIDELEGLPAPVYRPPSPHRPYHPLSRLQADHTL